MSGRAANASFYPMGLLKAILKGMQMTRDAQHTAKALEDEGWDAVLSLSINAVHEEHEDAVQDEEPPSGTLPRAGGGHVNITYDPIHFKTTYYDEYTREPLPTHLVRKAIIEELEYFNAKVWELDDARKVMANKDSKVIRTRWVMCNKGDAVEPDVRARLVACEVANYKTDE